MSAQYPGRPTIGLRCEDCGEDLTMLRENWSDDKIEEMLREGARTHPPGHRFLREVSDGVTMTSTRWTR